MNYVHSFTVFGENKYRFLPLFPLIIRQHYAMYKFGKWSIYLHTDSEIKENEYFYSKTLLRLNEEGIINIKIVNQDDFLYSQRTLGNGMLWRLLPIWDDSVDYVFCRDLDSILTPRQMKYVTRFIKSGKVAHGINDNNAHNIPLMGGMVGFQTKGFKELLNNRSLEELEKSIGLKREEWDRYGADQEFLNRIIWPKVSKNAAIDKIQGPNDRSSFKDCCREIDFSHINQVVLAEGDNFTNYIGATNVKNTTHGEKTLDYMITFYNKYGESDFINRISEIEKESNISWREE